MEKIKYYKFDTGDGAMRRIGARVEYINSSGEWVEDRSLIRKFIGGDTDFEEITEEEAQKIAYKRKISSNSLKK